MPLPRRLEPPTLDNPKAYAFWIRPDGEDSESEPSRQIYPSMGLPKALGSAGSQYPDSSPKALLLPTKYCSASAFHAAPPPTPNPSDDNFHYYGPRDINLEAENYVGFSEVKVSAEQGLDLWSDNVNCLQEASESVAPAEYPDISDNSRTNMTHSSSRFSELSARLANLVRDYLPRYLGPVPTLSSILDLEPHDAKTEQQKLAASSLLKTMVTAAETAMTTTASLESGRQVNRASMDQADKSTTFNYWLSLNTNGRILEPPAQQRGLERAGSAAGLGSSSRQPLSRTCRTGLAGNLGQRMCCRQECPIFTSIHTDL
ncbi:unnamed protein product [Protopolystoma xenopodis]|uniref:Uncharacterized protein n=1 Tax=Protopolystoma xenopodis TaxID=117903 RepID=A0A3S5FD89_9PLAT|nr:unnamed protein product [Protopolystoma xenopodis]